MNLNSKFDILRGWPREGAIDEAFTINQTVPGTNDALPPGTVIFLNSTGKAAAATTPNRTSANGVAVWVVVEGADATSTFTNKVVALRGNVMLRLEASNWNAGTYNIGTKLTFTAGKWAVAAATNQVIGEVMAKAADGTTMDVFFTGGDVAAF